MNCVEIKVFEPLCSIIKDEHFDHFTITQLRTAFMLKLKDKTTKNEAGRIVYQQVLRLKNKGLFSKKETERSRDSYIPKHHFSQKLILFLKQQKIKK